MSSKRASRPQGKSKDPKYSQHSVWLQKVLYGKVSRKLMAADGQRHEFSLLVEHLLKSWLAAGGQLPSPSKRTDR